uniref:START domain-containing protein n=1 Tax=Steinernema glaseri TaxID=37863 RepID=A0A1I7YZJ4_9BILA
MHNLRVTSLSAMYTCAVNMHVYMHPDEDIKKRMSTCAWVDLNSGRVLECKHEGRPTRELVAISASESEGWHPKQLLAQSAVSFIVLQKEQVHQTLIPNVGEYLCKNKVRSLIGPFDCCPWLCGQILSTSL